MKRTVRKGVFETNSSSIHTLVISHIGENDINCDGQPVIFYCGEYGWGYDELCTVNERASYLWTYLMYEYQDSYEYEDEHGWSHPEMTRTQVVDLLKKRCEEINVNAEFCFPTKDDYFYIDHCSDWTSAGYYDEEKREYVYRRVDSIFEKMLNDAQMLKNYLFNDKNFIVISNDNSDDDREIDAPSDAEVYVKGN